MKKKKDKNEVLVHFKIKNVKKKLEGSNPIGIHLEKMKNKKSDLISLVLLAHFFRGVKCVKKEGVDVCCSNPTSPLIILKCLSSAIRSPLINF